MSQIELSLTLILIVRLSAFALPNVSMAYSRALDGTLAALNSASALRALTMTPPITMDMTMLPWYLLLRKSYAPEKLSTSRTASTDVIMQATVMMTLVVLVGSPGPLRLRLNHVVAPVPVIGLPWFRVIGQSSRSATRHAAMPAARVTVWMTLVSGEIAESPVAHRISRTVVGSKLGGTDDSVVGSEMIGNADVKMVGPGLVGGVDSFLLPVVVGSDAIIGGFSGGDIDGLRGGEMDSGVVGDRGGDSNGAIVGLSDGLDDGDIDEHSDGLSGGDIDWLRGGAMDGDVVGDSGGGSTGDTVGLGDVGGLDGVSGGLNHGASGELSDGLSDGEIGGDLVGTVIVSDVVGDRAGLHWGLADGLSNNGVDGERDGESERLGVRDADVLSNGPGVSKANGGSDGLNGETHSDDDGLSPVLSDSLSGCDISGLSDGEVDGDTVGDSGVGHDGDCDDDSGGDSGGDSDVDSFGDSGDISVGLCEVDTVGLEDAGELGGLSGGLSDGEMGGLRIGLSDGEHDGDVVGVLVTGVVDGEVLSVCNSCGLGVWSNPLSTRDANVWNWVISTSSL